MRYYGGSGLSRSEGDIASTLDRRRFGVDATSARRSPLELERTRGWRWWSGANWTVELEDGNRRAERRRGPSRCASQQYGISRAM